MEARGSVHGARVDFDIEIDIGAEQSRGPAQTWARACAWGWEIETETERDTRSDNFDQLGPGVEAASPHTCTYTCAPK